MATVDGLEFYFMITPIKIKEQRHPTERDSLQHWSPPVHNHHFEPDRTNSTGWHQWSQQGTRCLNWNHDPADTRSCSLFFDYERNYFLVTQNDCTTSEFNDIIETDEPWKRLQFEHRPFPDGRQISLVTSYPADGEFSLHAMGGRTWMPELLPLNYDGYDRSHYADMAGDLPILLGLAAFTCEPQQVALLRTMNQNFRPPRWIPHNTSPPAPCSTLIL